MDSCHHFSYHSDCAHCRMNEQSRRAEKSAERQTDRIIAAQQSVREPKQPAYDRRAPIPLGYEIGTPEWAEYMNQRQKEMDAYEKRTEHLTPFALAVLFLGPFLVYPLPFILTLLTVRAYKNRKPGLYGKKQRQYLTVATLASPWLPTAMYLMQTGGFNGSSGSIEGFAAIFAGISAVVLINRLWHLVALRSEHLVR